MTCVFPILYVLQILKFVAINNIGFLSEIGNKKYLVFEANL